MLYPLRLLLETNPDTRELQYAICLPVCFFCFFKRGLHFHNSFFFYSRKLKTEFKFFRLNCMSNKDVGAAACLIPIEVCSDGGKSHWNMLVSAVRQGVRQNMSVRWRLMLFRAQEMHVSAAQQQCELRERNAF